MAGKEVVVGTRGRINVASLVGAGNVADYYLGRRLEDGTIILEPAVVRPRRRLAALTKPEANG